MWTKRFYSDDLRSAVLKVKNELGSNAVILAHARMLDGVEVTATVEQEASSAPMPGQGEKSLLSSSEVVKTEPSSANEKFQYYDADKNNSGSGKEKNAEDSVNKSKQGKEVMPNNKLGRMMQASDNAIRSAIAKMQQPQGFGKEKQDYLHLAVEAEPPLLANRYNDTTSGNHVHENGIQKAKNVHGKKDPEKSKLIRQLVKLDISPVIAQVVAEALVNDMADPKLFLPQALALISNQIPIYKEDVTACGGTIALLGATGVGKTTTVVKMAARFALRHGKDQVALITTDNNRIAAAEQLRTYSNIMGFQFKDAHDDIELLDALNEFSDKAFVIIDTAGLGPKDVKSSKFYELFSGGITQIKNFLVMSATMHRSALEQSTKAFSNLKIDGSIITKVDETTSLGGPLSAAILNNMPVAYYSNGQQVPDDFHLARSHILMSRAVSVVNQFEELDNERINNQDKVGIESNVSF